MNARDVDNRIALIEAAAWGNSKLVQVLLDKGADVNIKDKDGKTASMWPEEEGNTNIVELLKRVGAK